MTVKVNGLSAVGFKFVLKSVMQVALNNFVSISANIANSFDKMIYLKDLKRAESIGRIFFAKSSDASLSINGVELTEGLLLNDNQFVLSVNAKADNQTSAIIVRVNNSPSDISSINTIYLNL